MVSDVSVRADGATFTLDSGEVPAAGSSPGWAAGLVSRATPPHAPRTQLLAAHVVRSQDAQHGLASAVTPPRTAFPVPIPDSPATGYCWEGHRCHA
jgi:hypothetical protein